MLQVSGIISSLNHQFRFSICVLETLKLAIYIVNEYPVVQEFHSFALTGDIRVGIQATRHTVECPLLLVYRHTLLLPALNV